jgi:hypothetical protein
VCLFNPNQASPSPLADLQGVPAEIDKRGGVPAQARGDHRAVREGKHGGHAEPEGRAWTKPIYVHISTMSQGRAQFGQSVWPFTGWVTITLSACDRCG